MTTSRVMAAAPVSGMRPLVRSTPAPRTAGSVALCPGRCNPLPDPPPAVVESTVIAVIERAGPVVAGVASLVVQLAFVMLMFVLAVPRDPSAAEPVAISVSLPTAPFFGTTNDEENPPDPSVETVPTMTLRFWRARVTRVFALQFVPVRATVSLHAAELESS